MKNARIILAVLLSGIGTASAQTSAPNAGWDARMAALQEEHDSQAGVAVSIVFDDSGSMNERDKIGMAKKAFRAWIANAPDSYRFGLVALNAGVLVPLARNDRARVLAAVERMRAEGGTPLARTIAGVAAEIRKRQAAGAVYERQVVVILTDGEDTSGRGPRGVQEEILALRAHRAEVIAFGYQGEGDYMRDCATHFYSPENEDDIRKGLNAIGSEIGDTGDVVVDDATHAIMGKKTALDSAAPTAAAAIAAPTPSAQGAPMPPMPTPSVPVAPSTSIGSGSHTWLWVALVGVILIARAMGRRR